MADKTASVFSREMHKLSAIRRHPHCALINSNKQKQHISKIIPDPRIPSHSEVGGGQSQLYKQQANP